MDNTFNRVARRRRRGQGGFTLIELLVVIAVLAILAAIVIFNVVGVTNRGSKSACDTDAKTIQTAVDAYINDNSGAGDLKSGDMAATDFGLLTTGGYIHSTPTSCLSMNLSPYDPKIGMTVATTYKP